MLSRPAATLPGLVTRFQEPPLLSRRAGSMTTYTAAYRLAEGRVDYMWPGKTWTRDFRSSRRVPTPTTTADSNTDHRDASSAAGASSDVAGRAVLAPPVSARPGEDTAVLDAVSLAQALVRFPSLNPPGDEAACADYVARLLHGLGFDVQRYEFAADRPSLVARVGPRGGPKPLAFTGHLDVVPTGAAPWRHPPFEAVIEDGKLYGRGACDMKSGVAAFVAAAARMLDAAKPLRRGLVLVVTAGEETGCEGAFDLARRGVLGETELLIVAEPTGNRPVVAHKGSLRLAVSASGRTAHSSMPEEGDNAISRLISWIARLEAHRFERRHPLLGGTTAVVTTVVGGRNINSVPDAARFTVDIRTLPDDDHGALVDTLRLLFGPEARLETVTDFRGFSTDPAHPALAPLFRILRNRAGCDPAPLGAPYFTDASALVGGFGDAPAVVIGPGDPAQCHKTDEHCPVAQIEAAVDIYTALMAGVCF